MKCPLCDMDNLDHFVARRGVPVMQNITFPDRNEARNIKRGNIDLTCCRECGYIFNAAFEDIAYTQAYENDQSHSSLFAEHIESLVEKVRKTVNSLEGTVMIVEVGCGQGHFLQDLCNKLSNSTEYQAIGFDPAYRSSNENLSERLRFVSDYFSRNYIAEGQFDWLIVIARHVIEHISNVDDFLSEILRTNVLGGAYLFLETPDFDWILENTSFEDIVYEHCSFFNPVSMQYILRRFGCESFHIEKTFHGQYMWIEAKFAARKRNELIMQYQEKETQFIDQWREMLVEEHKSGSRLFIWGAGAKGVAFANLLDPDCLYIDAVVDINPQKTGNFLAGTGHRIISPEECVEHMPEKIIVMNRNYYKEIQTYLYERIQKKHNLHIISI